MTSSHHPWLRMTVASLASVLCTVHARTGTIGVCEVQVMYEYLRERPCLGLCPCRGFFFSVITDVLIRQYLLDIYIRNYMVFSQAHIFHSNAVSKVFADDVRSHRCHHSWSCIYQVWLSLSPRPEPRHHALWCTPYSECCACCGNLGIGDI